MKRFIVCIFVVSSFAQLHADPQPERTPRWDQDHVRLILFPPPRGARGLERLKSYLDGAVHQYNDWNYKELSADSEDKKQDLEILPGFGNIRHLRRCLDELMTNRKSPGSAGETLKV